MKSVMPAPERETVSFVEGQDSQATRRVKTIPII